MAKATEGVALWALPRAGAEASPSIEVHFNYWRLSPEKRFFVWGSRSDLLEIGLMLSKPSSTEIVSVYLPFQIKHNQVTDLSTHFEDTDLAQAIFNEAFSSISRDGRDRWIDLRKGNSLFCRVRRLPVVDGELDSQDLIVRPQNGGTVISLTRTAIDHSIEELGADDRLYFRIRVDVGSKKRTPFVDVISPWDRHFQSGFDEVEVVNFRVNEARTLPNFIEEIIREEQSRDGSVPISRLVFLTAVPVVSGISISHPAAYKSRLLENEIWRGYVPSGTPRRMMVYHWRLPAAEPEATAPGEPTAPAVEVGDFAALVKLQTRRSGPIVLLVYLLIALAFGFAGNIAASMTERALGWDRADTTPTSEAPSIGGPESGNHEPSIDPPRSTETEASAKKPNSATATTTGAD